MTSELVTSDISPGFLNVVLIGGRNLASRWTAATVVSHLPMVRVQQEGLSIVDSARVTPDL